MAVISIDYDGTWSADPELFQAFAELARKRGHKVIMITQRGREWRADDMDHIEEHYLDYPIIHAAKQPKQEAALDAGFYVDIWIDDNVWAMVRPFEYTGPRQVGF